MNLVRLNLVLLVLGMELTVLYSQMCTDPLLFGNAIENGRQRLENTTFKTFEKVGLVKCLKICLQYSLCTSINFIRNNCTLLTGGNIQIQNKPGSITSEKKNWLAERISGNCFNHNCTNNSKCIETLDGFSCEVIGCVDPPTDFRNYTVFGHYIVWPINESVAIPCVEADNCSKIMTCQQNGFWSKDGKCPPCQNESKWTEWFDRDNPSYTGDHETLLDLYSLFPSKVCKNPSAIDVGLVGKASHLGGDVIILSLSKGLRCFNEYQIGGKCNDYQVRFCCNRTTIV